MYYERMELLGSIVSAGNIIAWEIEDNKIEIAGLVGDMAQTMIYNESCQKQKKRGSQGVVISSTRQDST